MSAPGRGLGPWSYLEGSAPTIAEDLAIDEALLAGAEAQEGDAGAVLRIWEPAGYAVVLGASGRVAAEVLSAAVQADGVPLARRSSGGGTVVVGPGVVNVTVVLPVGADPRLAAVDTAQGFVLERIAQALRRLGPEVELRGSGDLTLDGRKFAGSAQRRLRRHLLVHASILNALDLDRVDRYLRQPERQPAYRQGRPHREFIRNLGLPREEVVGALRAAWLPEGVPLPPAAREPDRVAALVRDKFADPAWIYRL